MWSRISMMAGLVAATLTMGCRNSRETDQMGQPRAVEPSVETTTGTRSPIDTDTTTPAADTPAPSMDPATPPLDTTTIRPGAPGASEMGMGAGGQGASGQGAQDIDVNEDADTISRSGAGDTSGGARSADPNVQAPSGGVEGTRGTTGGASGTTGTTGGGMASDGGTGTAGTGTEMQPQP